MSERVGAIKLGTSSGEPFLGRDYGHERDYSEAVAGTIDNEVRKLVEAAHDEAWEVLTQYRDVLDDLRSEEHTSELQSLMRNSYSVFCLKKQKTHKHKDT